MSITARPRYLYLQGRNLTVVSISSNTRANNSVVSSMSRSVVACESEHRIAQWASSSVLLIAMSTWVGSGDPDLHADPEDSEIPC